MGLEKLRSRIIASPITMNQITELNDLIVALRDLIALNEEYDIYRPNDIDLDSRITRNDFLDLSTADGENLYQTCLLRLNQAAFRLIFTICKDEGLWWEISLLDNDTHVVFYTGAFWGTELYPDLTNAETVRYTCASSGELALTKMLKVLTAYLIQESYD